MFHLLLLGLLVAQPACAGGLTDALEKAWQRSPQARALLAGEEEVAARRQAAESLTPAPAAIAVSERGDQLNANRGQREWELEIGVPLWLPGEKDARRRQAGSEAGENQAALLAQRLALAGQLREAYWNWRLALAEEKLARERLDSALALERSVERRVQAGDLARLDLNLARGETLAAQSAVREKQIRVGERLRDWQALTGEGNPPENGEEIPAPAIPADEHPLLQAARQSVEAAMARLAVVRETPRSTPELALFTRSERSNASAAYTDSVGVRLRLPLASEARNRPLLAAANRELIRAEAELAQARLRVSLDGERAQAALSDARVQLELAASQRELAHDTLQLTRKAFELGEMSLFNLLKTRSAHLESEQTLALRRIAVAQASARLNQAQGVLP